MKMYWEDIRTQDRTVAALANVVGSCPPPSSTSSSTCSCWSSRRRSTSATCSSRAAGWPSAGTRTSRPQGRQFEHERHLKAINEAADQLERLAEGSRGGHVSRNAVRVSAAAARRRARGGRPARLRGRAARARTRPRIAPSTTRSAAACPTTRSCTATRAACPIRSGAWAPWRASTSPPIRPSGGEEVQQWARVKFSHGVRTVPAGSMRFVDFSKPDPAEERVERFMIAAQRAMAEGEYRAGRPAARSTRATPSRATWRCCG